MPCGFGGFGYVYNHLCIQTGLKWKNHDKICITSKDKNYSTIFYARQISGETRYRVIPQYVALVNEGGSDVLLKDGDPGELVFSRVSAAHPASLGRVHSQRIRHIYNNTKLIVSCFRLEKHHKYQTHITLVLLYTVYHKVTNSNGSPKNIIDECFQ